MDFCNLIYISDSRNWETKREGERWREFDRLRIIFLVREEDVGRGGISKEMNIGESYYAREDTQ